MATFNDARIRKANDRPINSKGSYVLYWCQMSRRLTHNHSIDYAISLAQSLKKPLVIYEGLKLNYPWANARIHQFMLEGMQEQVRTAKKMGFNYWPFVETPEDSGHGLVRKIVSDACVLVTDDYPAYIVPSHIRAISKASEIAVHAVDGNGMIPLSLLGTIVGAAAHLRPRIHKLFAEGWEHRATQEPEAPKGKIDPPFEVWQPPEKLEEWVQALPIDQSVKPVPIHGGAKAGRETLDIFVSKKLKHYGTERNHPNDPEKGCASGLSPYLHFGHVSIQEVCEVVLGKKWTLKELNLKTRNKDDFFCREASVNGFLDEAITWRDLGFHWHYCKDRAADANHAKRKFKSWQNPNEPASFNFESMDFSHREKGTLESVLPAWAWKTLSDHARDRREQLYTVQQFEAAETHDPLWNAAQNELVHTGKIHNYLRMLWAKKVLEWSETPEEAYQILEYLNNKYAIDGRDPNSYTGILWCFGLFDRPWPPERKVFGNIRFMSSDNTSKKFKLAEYLEYVDSLAGKKKKQGKLF